MSESPKPLQTRVTRLTVLPEGDPIFSEMATHIEIEDEAQGEFVNISQDKGEKTTGLHTISITPEEWPHIKAAIDQLIDDIKP
jgi:hypothetical protein